MEYRLIFKLTKHPNAYPFTTVIKSSEENLKNDIKERTQYFSELYGTPVKCVKHEILKEK